MPSTKSEIVIHPIGVVRSTLKRREDARDKARGSTPARLEILPPFEDGLDGLSKGDEILVLFWLHRLGESERQVLRVHPGGDRSKSKRGVFATRSPARPNPIGASTVHVVSREGGGLVVDGLDALDGSPIVDIKIGL